MSSSKNISIPVHDARPECEDRDRAAVAAMLDRIPVRPAISYSIAARGPAGKKNATEVVLILNGSVPDAFAVVFREAADLDSLIHQLRTHRLYVWGPEGKPD